MVVVNWHGWIPMFGMQIFNFAPRVTDTTYSDVQDGYAGTGNLNSDPLFVNAAHGDFTLQATSPSKNAGSGTMPDDIGDLDWDTITSEPVPLDLAGGPRVNIFIDMGAYELGAGPD